MQKASESIVDQRSQTFAKIEALPALHGAAKARWTRTAEGIRALLIIAEIHEREIIVQGEQTPAQGDQIAAQREQIAATPNRYLVWRSDAEYDERLNVLINM